MNEQFGLVLITERSLGRSITGHIIKDIFSRGVKPLELLEARMYAPSEKLIREYIKLILDENFKDYLKRQYIERNKGPSRKRMILLLFKGEDAISQIRGIVGSISRRIDGTLRNSFAEFIEDKEGEITGFIEPVVIIIPDEEHAKDVISLWAEYSQSDGGLLNDLIDWKKLLAQWNSQEYETLKYRDGITTAPKEMLDNIQQTLVLIKPDNIYTKSHRVGAIIDALAGPGLKMIGVKAVNMSVEQALEFYRPIEGNLIKKYGEENGKKAFAEIIKFMTGFNPYKVSEEDKKEAHGGRQQQSLALVYQGPFALDRIRNKIGATDPLEAAPGTIRREFGHDI
ncbi:MAG: nucleoside-diphosphate kinase [Candidatus Ratteibacteria bacterium]|nr:nucleoside-diphosphate kinase [Candidatus Ratteibacteria bacterium]